jgi:uncharacterized protein (DUF1800 family)
MAVAFSLCGLLVGQPVLAEAASVGAPPIASGGQIQGRERILHALNRFTFGPAPGEVAAVEKIGLDRWFEQQLNPSSIDDSALDARLAQYPAISLSIAELDARYPGPGAVRQMMNGRQPLPADPTLRVLAEDQIAFYKMQKAKQESKAAETMPEGGGTGAAGTNQAGEMKAGSPGEMTADASIADSGDQAAASSRRDLLMHLTALAPSDRFSTIMAMSPDALVRLRGALKGGEQMQLTAGMSPEQKETLLALGGSLQMIGLEAMESRVERDVYSNRQLEAVMTDFWLNHFNVYVRKNQQEAYLLPTYERETIRPHALGNFEDLLDATAESPAMLEYLDNARSIGPDSVAAQRQKRGTGLLAGGLPDAKPKPQGSAGLNENYGRELMELHTLGVNGGYTQADVTNVAKVFTGWTIDRKSGQFEFNENRHEPGAKTVLGKTIHEDGMKEGLQLLHMLATSPATAHFISQKLAVRFVSDDPPPALVDRMAASFLASHGDIKAVLRTMWRSPEFWSPSVLSAKVKTPEEFVFSAVRASGAEVKSPAALVQSIAKLGMPLYGMQTPNGYSWKQDDWVSTGALVSRMNFALVLAANRIPGTRTEWNSLLDSPAAGVVPAGYSVDDAAATKERRLEADLLGQPVSDRTRAAVLSQANDNSVTEQAETQFDLRGAGKGNRSYAVRSLDDGAAAQENDPQAAVLAGLLLGSPEFQRR